MKKLAILTSILALAACGGGSGGSGGGDVPPVISNTMPVENVTFDGGLSVQTNDKGQIVALVEGDTGAETAVIHVIPETGKISGVEWSNPTEIEKHMEFVDGAVLLYGRHVGLKFADFGMTYIKLMLPGYGTDTTWSALLAGNPDKEIQTINGTKAFTGAAVAVIGADSYTDGSDVMITNTDDANLVFNGTTGEYTLAMDFTKSDADKWYKVTLNNATDSTGQTVVFSNPNNVSINDTFTLANVSERISMDDMDGAFVSVNFYGEDTTASEATAELGVYDLEGAIGNTVHFHSTFGGKVAQ